jgi:hypothetical protein
MQSLHGLKGDKGDTGVQGNQGAQGTNGANGHDGAAGANGAQGPQGPKGDTGAPGQAGKDGTNGAPGQSGTAQSTVLTGTFADGDTSTLTCPTGQIAIGGGVAPGNSANTVRYTNPASINGNRAQAWTAATTHQNQKDGTSTIYVICAPAS